MPRFSHCPQTEEFRLADHHGKNVIVFFFPKADTAGCTKEAEAFSELNCEFEAANSLVIGISKDTPEKQSKSGPSITLVAYLEQILTLMCVNSLVYGLKNLCMAESIWAFRDQHS